MTELFRVEKSIFFGFREKLDTGIRVFTHMSTCGIPKNLNLSPRKKFIIFVCLCVTQRHVIPSYIKESSPTISFMHVKLFLLKFLCWKACFFILINIGMPTNFSCYLFWKIGSIVISKVLSIDYCGDITHSTFVCSSSFMVILAEK